MRTYLLLLCLVVDSQDTGNRLAYNLDLGKLGRGTTRNLSHTELGSMGSEGQMHEYMYVQMPSRLPREVSSLFFFSSFDESSTIQRMKMKGSCSRHTLRADISLACYNFMPWRLTSDSSFLSSSNCLTNSFLGLVRRSFALTLPAISITVRWGRSKHKRQTE